MTEQEMLLNELQLAKDQLEQGTLSEADVLVRLQAIIDEYEDKVKS